MESSKTQPSIAFFMMSPFPKVAGSVPVPRVIPPLLAARRTRRSHRLLPLSGVGTQLQSGLPGLTPAVQLVEGIDAALEVGEQHKLTGGLLDRALRRDRAQQRRDAPRFSLPVARALDRRRAVLGVKVIE